MSAAAPSDGRKATDGRNRPDQLIRVPELRSRFFYGRHAYLGLARQLELVARAHLDGPSRRTRLVDYGCGAMPFLPIFESRVDEYLGADLPENEQAHLSLVDGRLPIGPEEADVVLSTQVLEHVESPEIYLAECQRVLRPGGLLILSTHGHWPFHPTPRDHWRWTHTGLSRLVAEAGFEGIEVRASMNLLETGVQFFQEGVRRRLRAAAMPLVALTQNLALPLLAALTSSSRLLDGAVLIVVANRRA